MVAISAKPRKIVEYRREAIINAVYLLFVCTFFGSIHGFLKMTPQKPPDPPVNIVIYPSVCEEGPTSNIITTSLSTAKSIQRRGEYPYYHHMSQIVEGPGLTAQYGKDAICKFRQIKYWYHFPHRYVYLQLA
jgi:hypothetical protein